MFGWRRKNDGFEWHEYVRTTILIRRKARKEKIGEVRQAALDGLASAGQRGVEAGANGLKAAGQGLSGAAKTSSNIVVRWSQDAVSWLREGLKRLWRDALPSMMVGTRTILGFVTRSLGQFARWTYEALALVGRAGGRVFGSLASSLGSVIAPMARPELALPVGVISLAAAAGAVGDVLVHGLSPLFFGALLLSSLAGAFAISCVWDHGGSAVAHRLGFDRLMDWIFHIWPEDISFRELSFRRFGIPAGVLAGAGVIGFLFFSGVPFPSLEWFESSNTSSSTGQSVKHASGAQSTVQGRAKSLSGDQLRIQGTVIKLSGIEAPELNQRCVRQNGTTWRCGNSALRALQRITGRHKVVCKLGATKSSGLREGTCRIGKKDIAAELVRKGFVFATAGFFSTYASQEAQARAQKLELWRGKALRPKDFRKQLWNIAAQKSPNGCPVKGSILSSLGKVYLMPWSRKYDRTRIRTKRGERWFCSEQEALDAGWKPYRKL